METTRWLLHCPLCDRSLRLEDSSEEHQTYVIEGMRSGELSLTHPASDGTTHSLVLHPSLALN